MDPAQYLPLLDRRGFLKVASGSLFALATLPTQLAPIAWSGQAVTKSIGEALKASVHEALSRVKPAIIDEAGYFNLLSTLSGYTLRGRVELLETEWNKKHFDQWYRLREGYPWAIVLHWDGGPNQPRSLAQLVNGLNHSENIQTLTEAENSAHFGVGDAPLRVAGGNANLPISIAHLQRPWLDGTPLIASHIRHEVGRSNQRQGTPGQVLQVMQSLSIPSVLIDIHHGARFDPNFRTIAIEITGKHFDQNFPEALPSNQLLANLLTLLRTLMVSYQIHAWDILGHFELQADKPDPGKLFMAQVRFLLGIYALQTRDIALRPLVFGQYLHELELLQNASLYFGRLHEFTKRLTTDEQFRAWDEHSGSSQLLAALRDQINPNKAEFHPGVMRQ